jgi:hypothetical protein
MSPEKTMVAEDLPWEDPGPRRMRKINKKGRVHFALVRFIFYSLNFNIPVFKPALYTTNGRLRQVVFPGYCPSEVKPHS